MLLRTRHAILTLSFVKCYATSTIKSVLDWALNLNFDTTGRCVLNGVRYSVYKGIVSLM